MASRRQALSGRTTARSGFTLLEVLVSLAILAVLSVVVHQAAIGLLRASTKLETGARASLVASRIATASWLGTIDKGFADGELDARFTVEMAKTATGAGAQQVEWNTWTITPSDRSGGSLSICLMDPKQPVQRAPLVDRLLQDVRTFKPRR